MRFLEAMGESQTGYVSRHDATRGVTLFRTARRAYVQIEGLLKPCAGSVPAEEDWEPVQSTGKPTPAPAATPACRDYKFWSRNIKMLMEQNKRGKAALKKSERERAEADGRTAKD